jgi:hypothetical protein
MQTLPNYELLEVLTEEEPCSFRARQVSSGRTVLLHRLSGGPSYPDQVGLIRTVVRYLRQASAASRRLVLDMVEHDGAMYLVTEVLPGFRTFSLWLASELKGQDKTAASLQVTAPGPAASPQGGAGESPMQPPETRPNSGSEEVGEFTRMFQGTGEASPPHQDELTQPDEKVPLSPDQGKSTELFQPSGNDRSKPLATEVLTETSEKVAAPPEAGEFTRIFQHSAVDSSSRVIAEVPEVPSDKAASPEPGEFTRLFQAPGVDKPGRRPAEVPDNISGTAPSQFTAIFKSPTGAESLGAPDIQPSTPNEVGEFTRVFGSPAVTGPPSERLSTSRPAEPATPPQLAVDESVSGPQGSTKAKPQQPDSDIPPIGPLKVAKKPPLPAPKVPSTSPPKVPDKLSRPTRPAEPAIQHAPPVIAPTVAPKVPQPKWPQPELPASEERTSYLPWILILGGLVLLGVLLIVYVFIRG